MKYEGGHYSRRLEFRRTPNGEWKSASTPGPCPNLNDDELLCDWRNAYPQYEWRIAPAQIETLTDEERAEIQDTFVLQTNGTCEKALRIIDAQAARITDLEAGSEARELRAKLLQLEMRYQDLELCAKSLSAGCADLQGQRDAAKARIAELEAERDAWRARCDPVRF